MFEEDAKRVLREFKTIVSRAKNRKEHLSVTLTQLYALHDEVENLFHDSDLDASN
jgi:hypothetical protein